MSSAALALKPQSSVRWTAPTIGEVCRLINGRAYKKSELLDEGRYRVLRVGNFFTSNHWYFSDLELEDDKYCDDGDLLYAWSASFGPRIWSGNKTIYHYHIWKVKPDPAKVLRNYLFYFFEWDKELIRKEQGAGATMIHVSKGSMEARAIPLPPLDEQKRIVAVLDQAFAAIDRARALAEANLADAVELMENSLNEVFRGLAATAPVVRLENAVHPDCKLSYGIVQPGDDVEVGLPIVRPVDLKQRIITLAGLKRISTDRADGYARTKLVGDELLLCVRGSTGELSIASSELAGGNVTRGIVPIRFESEKVLHEFAYFQFRSRYVRDQIAAKTYGAALMQINIKDLRQLSFVVPPISQQRVAVARAESLYERSHKLCDTYARKLADLANLRQSLLQKAFSGELT